MKWDKMCLQNMNAPAMANFSKTVTLTLTDDLELVTNRKVLSPGILMSNIKALTITNQKMWPM